MLSAMKMMEGDVAKKSFRNKTKLIVISSIHYISKIFEDLPKKSFLV